ncbi:MAG: hypothetical protein SCM11_04035 [Bacillota bacterium]|nr:hypothetical protein [Bacillota bacterium]
MRWYQQALSILLCAVIVISTLLMLTALFMRNLIFNEGFYLDVISSPAYQPLVRSAIVTDLDRQSSYVGIPLEVLTDGLDETMVYMKQRQHVANIVAFLNFRADYVSPEFSAETFTAALRLFIEDYAAANNLEVTSDQLEQLEEVAEDAALIVQNHVTLLDLSQIKNSGAFQRVHLLIYNLSHRLAYAFLFWAAALICLIFLHVRSWRTWLNRSLISLWLAGSLLLVPTIVLDRFALHQRLAIDTPYLQYAVRALLQAIIHFYMIWGAALFGLASLALIILFFTNSTDRSSKPDKSRMPDRTRESRSAV